MMDMVTDANEQLIRTFHPAFFDAGEADVLMMYSKRERSM